MAQRLTDEAEIAARVRATPHRAVYIDGGLGAGKSTLGEKLAGLLRWTWLDFDCDHIIDPPSDPPVSYGEQVNASKLAAALAAAGPAVISGACMRDVLERLPDRPDGLHVYVSPTSFFPTPDPVSAYEDGNAHLPKSRAQRDVAEYHRRVRPHSRADLIYVWTRTAP